jgi:hypothetical protein
VAAAAPPTLEAPPVAPEVSEQQAGPSAQFIQGQEGGQPGSASALVEQKLNQVASDLKEIAKILVQSKPNLVPLLQRSIQALSMLMNEVQQGKQQVGQQGVQRQMPAAQGPEGPEEGSPPPSM